MEIWKGEDMSFCVVSGAMTFCSMGMSPSTLNVLPVARCLAGSRPVATITDNIPMVNVMSFGLCRSPLNPEVMTATTAAGGVLVPMPCIPVTVAPWIPGSPTVLVGGKPALNNSCKLMCAYAGTISIMNPGVMNVEV